MEIIYKNCPKIKISELEYGEAFIVNNKLCMRIRSNEGDSVSLKTGELFYFTDAIDVVRANVQVIVKK